MCVGVCVCVCALSWRELADLHRLRALEHQMVARFAQMEARLAGMEQDLFVS